MGAEKFAMGFCLIAMGCASGSASQAGRSNPQWVDWFGEYAEESRSDPRLLTIFKNRFVETRGGLTVEDRERSDTADYFQILKEDEAYYVDRLPVFLPSSDIKRVIGPTFSCTSEAIGADYNVVCETKDRKWRFRSLVSQRGVEWFEYFCRWPLKTCKFNFSTGVKLLNPKQRESIAGITVTRITVTRGITN